VIPVAEIAQRGFRETEQALRHGRFDPAIAFGDLDGHQGDARSATGALVYLGRSEVVTRHVSFPISAASRMLATPARAGWRDGP
jgi:hypothetical protein